jgi:phage terminase large subunit GpA-like protein
MHFSMGCEGAPDAEYFAQLGAEQAVYEKVKGGRVRKYVQVRDRNESIDVEALALAALRRPFSWDYP